MPYFSHDDIAHIATPPGHAPVGALRLSGDNAFRILAAVSRGVETALRKPRRSVHDGVFLLPLSTFGAPAAEKTLCACPARFLLMPAPASYTREDVAEIHLPGSHVILNAALAALVAAGARPAAPGEFTFRAYRNGRLTLAQAEAVEAVVRAGTDAGRRLALARLGDGGGDDIARWRDRLMDAAARLEAALDFAEDDEAGSQDAGELLALIRDLDAALPAAEQRDIASGLPHVALAGLANAGKSSLFNRLLAADAALVAAEASTTRDSLRRGVNWHGREFVLSDNPGYEAAAPTQGALAAARANAALGGADALCWVVDAARPLDEDAAAFARRLAGREVVLVLNKADAPACLSRESARAFAARHGVGVRDLVRTSAVDGRGVEALRRRLAEASAAATASGGFTRRERLELVAARDGCRRAAAELSSAGRLELAAEELRLAAGAFSRALGEGYAEEALGRIFSTFCLGK